MNQIKVVVLVVDMSMKIIDIKSFEWFFELFYVRDLSQSHDIELDFILTDEYKIIIR